MKIGVDYYPEQWDRALWNADADLMARTGVKLVRLGEFAWSRLEPKDGEFDFTWLDEAIINFSRRAMGIVLCTPTSCPPMWMYETYPDIVQVGTDGNRLQTGIRAHRCLNAPMFLYYAKRITEQLAKRYANNPAIAAWQIDNELEAYPCTCEVCRGLFRDWLIDKYDDLANINAAFGNIVWSGEYSDISQIQPPNAYPKAWQNPALCLEYSRFSADMTAKFAHDMAMIIKRENPRAKVTTNTFFSENTPDFYKLFSNLDFVSYDNYPPVKLTDDSGMSSSHAFRLDMMRGVKQKNFWVMEQLSGPTGSWMPMGPTPRPGQIKGYAMQAMAHGADTVMHFRWRTANKGAEMYWHGLIDHSNVPGRRFNEFAELCRLAPKLSVIETTELVSDVAILYSYDNDAAFRIQPQTEGFSYFEQLRYFHAAFSKYGVNVDIVPPTTDLSKYKAVIAPSMYVYDKSSAENIYRYVIKGGTVVMTARSGVKDPCNNCIMEPLPTVYREMIGAEVSEYDPIGKEEQTIVDFAGNTFKCRQWCDILELGTARAYAEYKDSFYSGKPAVTMNRYCSGVAYYIGTVCHMDFYEKFAGNIMKQTGIPRLKDLPKGVEVTTRTNGLDDYIFFFNNSEQEADITLPKAMFSIIDDTEKDKLKLKPFDMDIVRK
ncbi:MAG: beta-galactosidase [Ruminococcus sp.]|uniref:beta-galactosidase n=1 Tax=Ruminococcus sp. TaxID=41978 RepID=UPI0025D9E26D|nr:beta-galactosidase [Ruminococcus sp.]MBR6996480.1 beta-galactosidase [Ruminococcus sp.]